MAEIVTADEAIGRIPDEATVLVNPLPCEEVFPAFGRVFTATGSPKDLTVVWAAGIGPFSAERRGMNHFAYPGMVKRLIGGHYGLNYVLTQMVADNEVEAYNLPQGVLTQLYREIAAKRPGLLTRVGLGTFVDPRIEGGKMNDRARRSEDLVEVVTFDGEERLFYRSFPVDVGVVRGTTADPCGNITCEDEALTMENLEVAMAVKNCGGFVIAQVASLRDTPANPHDVRIPGIFVDYVVVAQSRKTHPHTLFVEYDPSYSGQKRATLEQEIKPLRLGVEKIICRRAAMALRSGMIVNLGVGVPMGVAAVAFEEGVLNRVTFTTEDRSHRRTPGGRAELRSVQESVGVPIPGGDVRLLRRRGARTDVCRSRAGRPGGERKCEPAWHEDFRMRRLHQHHADRADMRILRGI